MNRYLSRAWYRAGIPEGRHEDCSQAVYLALLQNLERDDFDSLVGDIGNLGIRDVVNRESERGPDFFRAVDTIKKRASANAASSRSTFTRGSRRRARTTPRAVGARPCGKRSTNR